MHHRWKVDKWMNEEWILYEWWMNHSWEVDHCSIHWWSIGWMMNYGTMDECWMNEKANECWMDYERMNDQYWISVLDINDRWMMDESFMKCRWMLKKWSILWMMNELGMQDALIIYCINERWMNTKKHGCKSIWYIVQSC
jgi:hypothetical protein